MEAQLLETLPLLYEDHQANHETGETMPHNPNNSCSERLANSLHSLQHTVLYKRAALGPVRWLRAKVLAAKPYDLSWIPEPHSGAAQLPQAVL